MRDWIVTPDKVGSLIGGVFGLVYVVANAGALPATAATVLRAIGIAAFAGLLLLIRRSRPPATVDAAPRSGFGRSYRLVVGAEVAAIVAGVAVLRGPLHAPHAVVAWVSVVVGAHFLALSAVWHETFFRKLGAVITLCGVAGLFAAGAGTSNAVIAVIGGVSPGAVLLGAGYWGTTRQGGLNLKGSR